MTDLEKKSFAKFGEDKKSKICRRFTPLTCLPASGGNLLFLISSRIKNKLSIML
jgi:hypothetical protein